jgi:hypothetical protein
MNLCACCKSPTPKSGLSSWTVQACADKRRKRVLWLCDACDAMLNRQVLILLGDKDVNAKMRKYRG